MNVDNNDTSLQEEGMSLYEYIVDHASTCCDEMNDLIMKLKRCDTNGQFLASAARYLAAVDRETFEPYLGKLVEAAIEKDRDHRYISSLLEALWGADYKERAEELRATDDNFRRIYRRIYPGVEPM